MQRIIGQGLGDLGKTRTLLELPPRFGKSIHIGNSPLLNELCRNVCEFVDFTLVISG